MRVLILAWEYPPHVVGGLGRHVADLAPALAGQGVELQMITPRWSGGEPEEESGGLRVLRVEPPAVPVPDFYTRARQTNVRLEEEARRLCDRYTVDVVHNHDWLTVFAGAAIKRRFKLPMLSTIHATEMGRARGTLVTDQQRAIHSAEWWLCYESWRVICCSQFMVEEVAEYFKTPLDKLDVIPNGVKVDRYERLQGVDLSGFRSMYALPDEQIVFYVGRIVGEKGLHLLVESVPLVLAENPRAKFVIAGTGPLLERLRSRTLELGVGAKVVLTGFISDEDRDRLYKVASCAVFPSLYEPFGIVALEAMAARTPVVVSDVGGLHEVVKNFETGITVYPNNVALLAWGINHTLSRPDWAQLRAAEAFETVVRDYSWDTIARQTRAVYERVMDERAQVSW